MINKKVSLDTQIVIWGIKKESSPNRIGMIEKSTKFIQQLEKQNARVILPAIVIAEMLSNVPKEDYEKIINCIVKNFQVQPFDYKTALIYASQFYETKTQRTTGTSNLNEPGAREKIKADLMVVACAKAAGVGVLYSEDPDIIKLSSGLLKSQMIPEMVGQLDLFPNEG